MRHPVRDRGNAGGTGDGGGSAGGSAVERAARDLAGAGTCEHARDLKRRRLHRRLLHLLVSHGTRKTITRNHLAAINERTGAPLAWNPNVNGAVHSIRVIGTRVYVGGSFTSIGGHSVHNLAAIGRSSGRS